MELKKINALDTKIIEATVYPDMALVTREGELKLSPGHTEVKIIDLPLTLDVDSVRVKGTSNVGAIIEGIDVQRVASKDHAEPNKRLIDTLESLENDLVKLIYEQDFIKMRLENNVTLEKKFATEFPRYYSRGNVTLETFTGLSKLLEEEYQRLKSRLREIINEKEELNRKIEIVKNEIYETNVPEKADSYSVTVYLSNSTSNVDKFKLLLSYLVDGASWYPLYDFRNEPSEGKVMIDYLAMVQQHSGENWDEIDLVLSTAKPSVLTTIPELKPWNLTIKDSYEIAESHPAPMVAAKKTKSDPKFLVYPRKPEEKPAESATADIEDSAEIQIFKILKKESIQSSKKPKQVLVSQIENPVVISFLSIPSKMSEVLIEGEMTNKSGLILLPGEVSLFNRNEFIGKTKIKQISPMEKYTFVLGTTGKIKVERRVSSEEVSKKGMVSKTRVRKFEITIKVTNNRTELTKLTIKDRLPISKHEDVKVKGIKLSPEPYKRSKQNICEWKLTLKPQEKLTIHQFFEIEVPIDEEIVW